MVDYEKWVDMTPTHLVRQADGYLGAKVSTAFNEKIMKVNPCAGKPGQDDTAKRHEWKF